MNRSGTGNTIAIGHAAARQSGRSTACATGSKKCTSTAFASISRPCSAATTAAFAPTEAFFKAVAAEPSLRYVKLIAEPWDIGPDGYHLSHFPAGWAEWNDLYRDTMRGFWRGNPGILGNFAERFAGSSDLFRASGRRPTASINYVACHDGFTLFDATAYEQKHNEANLEDNRDGHNHNLSWNCGVEGPTDDPQVNELRERQIRNLARDAAPVPGRAHAARRR